MNQEEVIIYADIREAASSIALMLAKKCAVREKQLHIGDYQLSERMGAERKTTQDFISSIMDGRLFRQLHELKAEFEIPILIIEGQSLFDTEILIHPNAIRGAVAAVVADVRVGMIWTKNPSETADMLFALAKREQVAEKRGIAIRGKAKFLSENQQQEFVVAGLPKISTLKAKALLKHFGTPEAVFTADEEALRQVPGIGEGIARVVRRLLERKYEKSILED
ncbi:MAG TPA: ERCC4 domain-containing protein [archaeon]|nr:ERCC4 domain-containing protein [archaeon]